MPGRRDVDSLSTSMSLRGISRQDVSAFLGGATTLSLMLSPGGLEIDSLLQEGSDSEKLREDWRKIGGDIQRAIETVLHGEAGVQ